MCPCEAFISQVVCSCPQHANCTLVRRVWKKLWSKNGNWKCAIYFLGKGLCSLFLSLHVIWPAEKMLRASDPCCISVCVTINQKAGSLCQQLFQILITILIYWGAFHYTRLTGHWVNQKTPQQYCLMKEDDWLEVFHLGFFRHIHLSPA